MFDNNTNIYSYKYEIKLDDIIFAICNIAYDIGVQIDGLAEEDKNVNYAANLFNEEWLKSINIDKETFIEKENGLYKYNKDSFFSQICSQYNNNILNNTVLQNSLNGQEIAFINKTENIVYTHGSSVKDFKDKFINGIKKANIITEVIEALSSDKIKLSLNQINKFEHFALYTNVVKLTIQEGVPLLPFLYYDLIDTNLVTLDIFDNEFFWINVKSYKKKYTIDIKVEEDFYQVIDKSDQTIIGIKIGNYILPFANTNLKKLINAEEISRYQWLFFKENLAKSVTKLKPSNPLLKKFTDSIKDAELNILLSFLVKNLYVRSDVLIPDKYIDFFTNFTYIDNLKHLDDFEFYIPQAIKESALGVYTNSKKGSSYNLLHWLNHEDEGKFTYFPGPKSESKDKNLVSVLKPDISFYILEKYFEDILEKILKENNYEYLSNVSLDIKGTNYCEIDFLINSGGKFFYIECKTKLTKDYIYEFLEKSSTMLTKFREIFGDTFNIEFVLLSGFSDVNVKNYQHFINLHPREDYNTNRDPLNTIPYYFKVPIPNIVDKNIVCIAEPEYDRLEHLIKELCPK